ncbi:hypothetical protein BU15DRAFT_65774 [Melanogaster broomeanus]|nr:hypothetical protein BU15DRAFT_65774 [Melanogaster broomeanus]
MKWGLRCPPRPAGFSRMGNIGPGDRDCGTVTGIPGLMGRWYQGSQQVQAPLCHPPSFLPQHSSTTPKHESAYVPESIKREQIRERWAPLESARSSRCCWVVTPSVMKGSWYKKKLIARRELSSTALREPLLVEIRAPIPFIDLAHGGNVDKVLESWQLGPAEESISEGGVIQTAVHQDSCGLSLGNGSREREHALGTREVESADAITIASLCSRPENGGSEWDDSVSRKQRRKLLHAVPLLDRDRGPSKISKMWLCASSTEEKETLPKTTSFGLSLSQVMFLNDEMGLFVVHLDPGADPPPLKRYGVGITKRK